MARSDDGERVEDFAALAELAEGFDALVQALHDGDSGELSPRRIVEPAAACVPRSQHAALTVVHQGQVRTIAATSDMPERLDRVPEQAAEGPAIDVLETNDLVPSSDIADDPRWPLFGAQVRDSTRIRSIVSYRLYLSRHHRAALSIYSTWPYAFDELAIATGAIFAAYGSLTLTSELVLTEAVRRSADVRREIGVAIGILMTTADLTTQAAYRRLHQPSQQLDRSLPHVARQVAHRGLPDSSSL